MSSSEILDMDFSFDDEWASDDLDFQMLDARMVSTEESQESVASDEEAEVSEEETDDEDDSDEEDTQATTLKLLETIVFDLLQQLTNALPSVDSPRGKNTSKGKIVVEIADRRKPLKADGSCGTRRIVFPQRGNFATSKPLAQLFKVIDLMHEAITDGIPTTKRDIFYKDVQLFRTQATVNRLVDDIAATIGSERADLHVRASSKGLFCGTGLTIHMRQGDIIRGNATESTLIPPSEDIVHFDVSDRLSWVLVVEKEAVFQTLCHLGFSEHAGLSGSGLIITGKGYPDVVTRQLLCTLSNNLPQSIPILAFVDADPYGIDILSVYKYGSTSMAHQQDSLAAPRIKWLGVMASELAGLGIDRDALLHITRHDKKKALAVLQRPNIPRKWRKELQHMLFHRRKAEIEILSTASTGKKVDPEGLHGTTQGLTGHDVDSAPPQESMLVRYLVSKIGKAAGDCGKRR